MLLVFVFSNDAHFLWLLYDFLALYAVYKTLSFWMKPTQAICLFFLLVYMLFLSSRDGFHVISILSIWDNIKHLFIMVYLSKLIDNLSLNKLTKYANVLSKFLTLAFFIQFFMVLYQQAYNYHIDDISGTFGYRASHSVGYFCLMYIAFLMYLNKGKSGYISLIIIMSMIINYYSENIGFYVLLLFLLSSKKPLVALYALCLGFILVLLVPGFYDFTVDVFLNRVIDFFTYPDDVDYTNVVNRSAMTMYAWGLGGWVGAGFGAFTEQYNLTGWLFHDLANKQVSISTFTTMLAEYGVLGMVLILILYFTSILGIARNRANKIILLSLFCMAFLYNRLLMDERIIYQLIFIFMFIKLSEIHKVYLVK